MIEIKNLRTEKPEYEYDIKVDRSNKILGNKFVMHNESERNEVCDKYAIWLSKELRNKNEDVVNEMRRIYDIYKKYGKLNLYCWCYPKRCHAEEIKRILLIKERLENKNESNM